MFSDLATAWPPTDGPTQGYKHEITTISADEEYSFNLQRLHAGAWWTGFYVAGIGHESQVQVILRRYGGAVAFDAAEDQCKWTQQRGTWNHLPWPIPAAMADAMGLYLEISVETSTYLTMKASFHEMDGLDLDDRYLFITGDGIPVHHWDGERQGWGNPITGVNPAWAISHTVVPTIAQVLALCDWDDNRIFTIHDWNTPA